MPPTTAPAPVPIPGRTDPARAPAPAPIAAPVAVPAIARSYLGSVAQPPSARLEAAAAEMRRRFIGIILDGELEAQSATARTSFQRTGSAVQGAWRAAIGP